MRTNTVFIQAILFSFFLLGCATFYRSNYSKQTQQAQGYQGTDCGESLWFGAKNGVKISGLTRGLYVCSYSQSGNWITTGPLIPIFPTFNSKGWADSLRWIKFGLKPDNHWGWLRTDSLEISITSIEYFDSGDVFLSPTRSLWGAAIANKHPWSPVIFKVYNDNDFWLGIPGKGDIVIEFEAEGFGKKEVRFSPTTGYSYGLLGV